MASEARKEYKRMWMRRKRAAEKGATVPTAEVQSQSIPDRIASLEAELAALKAQVSPAGLNLTIEPTPEELRYERIRVFEQDLNGLHNYASIDALRARINDVQQAYEQLCQDGDWPRRLDDLKQIAHNKDKLHALEARAEYVEQMIARWSTGGVERRQREAAIEDGRRKGTLQSNSPEPEERRRGIVLLNACKKSQGELEVTLGSFRAELKALRS